MLVLGRELKPHLCGIDIIHVLGDVLSLTVTAIDPATNRAVIRVRGNAYSANGDFKFDKWTNPLTVTHKASGHILGIKTPWLRPVSGRLGVGITAAVNEFQIVRREIAEKPHGK